MQENSIFFDVFRKVSFYAAGATTIMVLASARTLFICAKMLAIGAALIGLISAYDHFEKFVVLELPMIAAVIALGGVCHCLIAPTNRILKRFGVTEDGVLVSK
ncbi:TPA: hypothetical protein ACXIJH_004840 [Serratia marcescens]